MLFFRKSLEKFIYLEIQVNHMADAKNLVKHMVGDFRKSKYYVKEIDGDLQILQKELLEEEKELDIFEKTMIRRFAEILHQFDRDFDDYKNKTGKDPFVNENTQAIMQNTISRLNKEIKFLRDASREFHSTSEIQLNRESDFFTVLKERLKVYRDSLQHQKEKKQYNSADQARQQLSKFLLPLRTEVVEAIEAEKAKVAAELQKVRQTENFFGKREFRYA